MYYVFYIAVLNMVSVTVTPGGCDIPCDEADILRVAIGKESGSVTCRP
jgi:hypothetical protein